MRHYHFGGRDEVLAAVIRAITGRQGQQISALLADEPASFVAGAHNCRATLAGADRYGAFRFELATHAMRGEPYAADLGQVMATAQIDAFTAAFAEHTAQDDARVLARLALAVGRD